MQQILERISDGIFAVDHQWRITYMNYSLETMLSVNREDCLHRLLQECLPVLCDIVSDELLYKAIEKATAMKYECFSSVFQRWFEIAAHPSSTGLIILIHDISEQKKIEQALLLSNERFRLAAKTDAIFDWDIPNNHLQWGEAIQDLFGYGVTELERIEQWKAAIHPDEVKTLAENLNRALDDPNTSAWEKEYRFRHRSGRFCFAYELGQILRDEKGNAIRMVGVMKNITERKLLENELELERKKATAAIISAQEQERFEIGQELHDNVNQILTSAKLYAAQSRDEQKDSGQMIEKTISLLQNAIDEIRKLSKRLSASIITDMPLEDAMRELVDTVAAASKLKINLESLPLKSSLNSPELKLAVYRILQEQLTNITKHASASNIDITLRQNGEKLTLIIVDDGRGFDTTQKTEGVGLTNMQSRAESLMGTLTLSSQPGKGTTVIVQLPFTQM